MEELEECKFEMKCASVHGRAGRVRKSPSPTEAVGSCGSRNDFPDVVSSLVLVISINVGH
jgi:hypothetical protein